MASRIASCVSGWKRPLMRRRWSIVPGGRSYKVRELCGQVNAALPYRRPLPWLAADDVIADQSDTFAFRSWVGCELAFTYPAPGDLYKSGELRRGWSSCDPLTGQGDDELWQRCQLASALARFRPSAAARASVGSSLALSCVRPSGDKVLDQPPSPIQCDSSDRA